jgi:2-polyprenyl-3-methyl-5-hydroxy-6-metoxy-1,4-benzoquinol methylase
MPKKIFYESAVHHFLLAADRLRRRLPADDARRFAAWVRGLDLDHADGNVLRVRWSEPSAGEHLIPLSKARFYSRGAVETKVENESLFDAELRAAVEASALPIARDADAARKRSEESFHDDWAAHTDVTKIDVRRANEACTAPEMRFIRAQLGDLRGRRLLDIGCGLGEASVYFAMEGADVTASDISSGMLDATQRLAAANGVNVATHLSAAEDLRFNAGETFDIIYAGNILHHVDIAQTLPRLCSVLAPDGIFVSWDPVAYNPVINVYRKMAHEVRTPDEHPLRKSDLDGMRRQFVTARTTFFWLTTLLVFLWMAIVQRRDPNKERYWKTVIDEADRWAPLYRPLALIDRVLLAICPPLGYLCWNVVFIGRNPRRS